jgi:hypothetical protein
MLRFHFGSDPLVLDEQTADGLVSQALPPDDAPPVYRDVAQVISALTQQPTKTELENESFAVAGIAATVASSPSSPSRRSSMPRKVRSPKRILVAVTVSCLSLVGGLAVAGAIDSVPSPNDASDGHSKAGEHTPTSIPPDDAGQGSENSGKGAEISGLATETDATGVDKGAEISDQASNGKSQAGDDHPAADVPPSVPVSTPGQAHDGLSHRP